jgi:hypothetical protein
MKYFIILKTNCQPLILQNTVLLYSQQQQNGVLLISSQQKQDRNKARQACGIGTKTRLKKT